MNYFAKQWRQDKLHCALVICWLLTVAASFFGSYLLPIVVPGVGTWFAFRTLLPLTAILYIAYTIRTRTCFWKDSTMLEKWVYILIAVMLLYSGVSLFRAIDIGYTFRVFFNLCFDLCFFFLFLRLCRDRDIRKLTMTVCFALLIIVMVMGAYEIFCGGIFNTRYDSARYKDFKFFLLDFQYPVVFYGNTNDYAILLTFLYSLFALSSLQDGNPHRWIVGLLTAATYFLLLACSSRLCLFAFFLVFWVQVVAWLLKEKRAALRSVIAICLCLCCVWLSNQWRFTVVPIQTYVEEYQEYRAGNCEKPTLVLGDPNKSSIWSQLFSINKESGKQELRKEGSAAFRTRLVLHALDCFTESYGLGVGLGNTETLAAQRRVVNWPDNSQFSLHCFGARVIADYGVFALIPLCVIAFLLLKQLFVAMQYALKKEDWAKFAYALLFLAVLLSYPFVSTASSDAQDNLPMWIYLGLVVIWYVENLYSACDLACCDEANEN